MTDFARRREMMVDTQVRPNDVTKYPVIAAMLRVPREEFVPEARREVAYFGGNVPLAPGRALLEPRSLAKLLDGLDIQPDQLVLVVGSGYGYSAAVVGQMAQGVVALEENLEMAAEAERRLAAQGADNVAAVRGPLAQGSPAQAPFDAILVDGAIQHFPDALAGQLREGGLAAAIWQEGALGIAKIGHKLDGRIEWRFAFNAHAPILPGFEQRAEFAL